MELENLIQQEVLIIEALYVVGGLIIGLVIGAASFSQWRVDQNEIRLIERGY